MLTETGQGPEFLRSEANGSRSREIVTVAASQTLKAGTVIGKTDTGAATVTPGAVVSGSGGTPGDGSIGTVTADALAPAGSYQQVFTSAGATALFNVFKPDGSLDGVGKVGTAYNGLLNFTQADGAADFAEGDYRPIVVAYAAGAGQAVIHDPEGTNGSQVVYGILYEAVTTGVGETKRGVAIVRDAEVVTDRLVWDDHSGGEKTAALAELAAKGILARD